MHHPVSNNFGYEDDLRGRKCPFQGHIRKTNPRGDSVRRFGVPLEEERGHLMARRGITYGKRSVKKVGAGIEFRDQPKGHVGLLFMAYQNDIANQFEFTQALWANNPDFVNDETGIDPVIGQGAPTVQKWPQQWGGPEAPLPFPFGGHVTLKGGEYFFAPSLATLAGL